jgi:hypothetical protein
MERRTGLRGTTDFPVRAYDGFSCKELRAVALSSSGILLRHAVAPRGPRPLYCNLELSLPERLRGVKVLARSVRVDGCLEAFRFLEAPDSDRLTLAEHLDVLYRRAALGPDEDRCRALYEAQFEEISA